MLLVRIANSPSSRERGLMFVTKLPYNEGMLFVFDRPQKLAFWGVNTYIPLDVAFIGADNIIKKISSINPHQVEPVQCKEDCLMAVEANMDYFAENNVKVGDEMVEEKETLAFSHGYRVPNLKTITFVSKSKFAQTYTTPIVKPDTTPPGEVIGKDKPQQVDENNLPVLDVSDLGKILEDSYDPEEQTQPEVTEQPEQPVEQEEIPVEEPKEQYPVFANVFDAASWAKENNQVMRISYITKHGRMLTRDVEPHGEFHSESTKHQILVTFDETIGDIRAYIMMNIRSWAFVGKEFQKRFMVKA